MKIPKSLFSLVLALGFLTHDAYARTCAEKIQTTAKWYAVGAAASVLAIPADGIGLILMGLSIQHNRQALYNAKILEVATSMFQLREVFDPEYQQVMDKFYKKIEKRYPNTEMSKEDVIEILAKVNLNQMGKFACDSAKHRSLVQEFFPEIKRDQWLEAKRQEDTKLERELNAARMRDQKNNGIEGPIEVTYTGQHVIAKKAR